MATDVRLITLDENGIRYLRESIAELQLLVNKQNLDLINLRNGAASSVRDAIIIGRAVDDIPAATLDGDDVTPGEGKIDQYTVRDGLTAPIYKQVGSSRFPLDVLNFKTDVIPAGTFPVIVSRLDDTGQLAIHEHPEEFGGFGTLVADAPQGGASAGGPTLLNVEKIDAVTGVYSLTGQQITVWNMCAAISAARVQYKRVIGGFLVDVECCPVAPAGPGGDPITMLGLAGVPTTYVP